MPSTPVVPCGPSRASGVAESVRSSPSRAIRISIGWPGRGCTWRCTCSKRETAHAVEREDLVAGAQAPARRGRAFHHRADRGVAGGVAGGHVEAGEEQHREQVVGHRPRRDDDGAVQHRLLVEGLAGAPGGARRGVRLLRHLLPVQLHVAAEREPAEAPFGAAAVGPAPHRLAEADREGVHMDAAPARGQVVAHLVDEHQHAEHQREGDQGARQRRQEVPALRQQVQVRVSRQRFI